MSRFTIKALPLNDLKLITRIGIEDNRGQFSRLFCSEELVNYGFKKPIKQINHSITSKAGTIRGLHYQMSPHSEMKLVSCIKGMIYDVAIDIRTNSPTFLQWHAEVLGEDNKRALLIPEGFAHGFQSLCDDCEIIYIHTESHNPLHEGGIRFDDPMLNINWPLEKLYCSERDQSHNLLDKNFKGVSLT